MARPTSSMIRSYAADLRLFPTAAKRVGVAVLIAAYLLVPYLINDTWASVLSLAGVVAIGAIGLNLLTGYTGQPSLGTAAFTWASASVTGVSAAKGRRPVSSSNATTPSAYRSVAGVAGSPRACSGAM